MNRLTCSVDGCTTVFHTEEAVSPKARFICKNHDVKTQATAAKIKYEEPPEVHFQDEQFDPELRRGRNSEGTSHVANQGSNSDRLTFGEINEEEDVLIDWIDNKNAEKESE